MNDTTGIVNSTHSWMGTISNEEVVNTIEVLASVGILIALIFTIATFFRIRNTDRLKLIENEVREIRTLERELNAIPTDSANKEKRENWRYLFFNELEWFGFLINTKEIDYKKVRRFYGDYIIISYEQVFVRDMKEDINNPKSFPEYKQLYQRLKRDDP